MSTLQLIWDSKTTYELWSWDPNNNSQHFTAQLVRPLAERVHLVRVGPRGAPPSNVVAAKIATGKDAVKDMQREFGLYENELKELQGNLVPICYGFWTTKVNGRHLGCLLLEYCSGPPGDRQTQQLHLRFDRAAYALHSAGVLHGDLRDGHFVAMGLDSRILDFSTAVPHICTTDLAQRAEGRSRHTPCRCPELASLEFRTYGRY
ncbi:hypothetical protein FB45DRAFT_838809 [Roridomyces roridus]|uniref:Protein kinase domain-containing protein n=1 Tax=Roridomyces roridus TaxID=1738132 RepID=A0AAD7BH63_9AGAR|nr:hypothetical protein FB45DRAFT_838809 [Roridomyces roridus]